MNTLPDQATLADYQTYIKTASEERGRTDRTDTEKIMMLTEELGEVAKEVRKHTGKFGYNKPKDSSELGAELVDVFNWLVDLANSNGIDLEQAFRAKWHRTATRVWDK